MGQPVKKGRRLCQGSACDLGCQHPSESTPSAESSIPASYATPQLKPSSSFIPQHTPVSSHTPGKHGFSCAISETTRKSTVNHFLENKHIPLESHFHFLKDSVLAEVSSLCLKEVVSAACWQGFLAHPRQNF